MQRQSCRKEYSCLADLLLKTKKMNLEWLIFRFYYKNSVETDPIVSQTVELYTTNISREGSKSMSFKFTNILQGVVKTN